MILSKNKNQEFYLPFLFNKYLKIKNERKGLDFKKNQILFIKDSNSLQEKYIVQVKEWENVYENKKKMKEYELNRWLLKKKKNHDFPFFVSNNLRSKELLEGNFNNKKISNNIYLDHLNNIKARKISNKLKSPYYYFSAKYNEKSNLSLSQNRHWMSSSYLFINRDKTGYHYLDFYTSKLLNMFFTIKYVNSKNPFKNDLKKKTWRIFKIKPSNFFINNINIMIKYTSHRANLILKKWNTLEPNILDQNWIKNQFQFSNKLNKLISEKINKLIFSRNIKEENHIFKLKRVLLSKPLFKHTPSNLIIDLFIFNNKTYKLDKLENIITRRSMYKYMYSMYINYLDKIKTTLNRPKFFYMNLIEPKIYSYYNWVLLLYDELLFRKNKSFLTYLSLLFLQFNYISVNRIKKIKDKFIIFKSIYSKKKYKTDNKFRDSLTYLEGKKNKEITGDLVSVSVSKKEKEEKEEKVLNTKTLWDSLDYSIVDSINKSILYKIQKIDNIKEFSYGSFFHKIRNYKEYGDIWYLMYFSNFLKKEFDKINRDILEVNKIDNINYKNNNLKNNFYSLVDSTKKESKENNINFEFIYNTNKREENLINKLKYNENIFKPYYRFILPKLILIKYFYYLVNLGYEYELFWYNEPKYNKDNNFSRHSFMLFNFVVVKTLFDLLHYNYRSLIRLKPKFYSINRIKFFEIKFRKLMINSWFNSLDYLKRLRKTPIKFWKRHDKLAKFYYKRIIQNAELDTKRKIFVPFTIYFEDILYNIYGKPVLIRLWPLKRFYLSSFILANRILTLILWRHKKNSDVRKYNFNKLTYLLINIFRSLQIDRAYNYYLNRNTIWPNNLLETLNKNTSVGYLHYTNSKYFSRNEDRDMFLRTFSLRKNELFNYISSVKFNYIDSVNLNINQKRKKGENNLKWRFKMGNLSSVEFAYWWLRPLNTYFLTIRKYLDITGVRFTLSGKAGDKSNNARSFYRTRYYGNFIGPWYTGLKTFKHKTEPMSLLRGETRSHIDYTSQYSKNQNGAISLKVWISSRIGSDIHDLLLHLMRIKYLYYLLTYRYYHIHSSLNEIKRNYYFKSVNQLTYKKEKRKNKIK